MAKLSYRKPIRLIFVLSLLGAIISGLHARRAVMDDLSITHSAGWVGVMVVFVVVALLLRWKIRGTKEDGRYDPWQMSGGRDLVQLVLSAMVVTAITYTLLLITHTAYGHLLWWHYVAAFLFAWLLEELDVLEALGG